MTSPWSNKTFFFPKVKTQTQSRDYRSVKYALEWVAMLLRSGVQGRGGYKAIKKLLWMIKYSNTCCEQISISEGSKNKSQGWLGWLASKESLYTFSRYFIQTCFSSRHMALSGGDGNTPEKNMHRVWKQDCVKRALLLTSTGCYSGIENSSICAFKINCLQIK